MGADTKSESGSPRVGRPNQRRSARIRRGLLGGIALLYALSIPWYRDPGESPSIILGLPDWVAVAVACYVGVAVLNALAWLLTDIPEELDSGGGEQR